MSARPSRRAVPFARVVLPVVLAAIAIATAVGPAAALTTTYPYQSQGNRGTNVRAIQHLLRHHGDLSFPGILMRINTATIRITSGIRMKALNQANENMRSGNQMRSHPMTPALSVQTLRMIAPSSTATPALGA